MSSLLAFIQPSLSRLHLTHQTQTNCLKCLGSLTPLRLVDTEDWPFFRSPLLSPLTQGTGTQVFRVWPPVTQLPRYLPASSGPLPHCSALSCFYSSTYFKFPQVRLPCLLKVSPPPARWDLG